MRILIVSHTYIVDINRDKLRALVQLQPDVEVTIVVPRYWYPGGVQKGLTISEPLDEGRFRVIPITNFSYNNQGLLTFSWEIVPLLWQFRPQIIQVEQGAKSLAYAQLIMLSYLLGLRAKKLFFTWWNLPYTLKFPVSWIEKFNLSNSQGIIVGNQDGAEVIRQKQYRGKIKIMPQLGVDEKLFCRQPQPHLAASLGIKRHDFVVGFVGRFVEEKGLITLLQSLAQLQDFYWKLLLVGRGELQPLLLNIAAQWGIENRLVIVDSVPHTQVAKYINLMNVLVLPSQTNVEFKTLTATGWQEQFGHVLIEAMACKVPVIGSDCGEIPHVIGNAGLTFRQGDVQELRDRLLSLISQPLFAARLGHLGYDRAMAYYTNKALAQQMWDFYQEL
ncbi:MAG: glycosyltransferase family 4 protein [Coleofasciculaceae cyanobacterium SM2_1_6]|nr:glycosyltransferase family 4 protein [Coleofasciculaceae cyanobacterium SM2_1_6]